MISPVLEPTDLRTTTVPPYIPCPAPSPADPSTTTSPSVKLSPTNHPAFPVILIFGPSHIVPVK